MPVDSNPRDLAFIFFNLFCIPKRRGKSDGQSEPQCSGGDIRWDMSPTIDPGMQE